MSFDKIQENILNGLSSLSMSPIYIFLSAFIFILLVLSAFFSGSETALTGASRAKLMGLKEKGSKPESSNFSNNFSKIFRIRY